MTLPRAAALAALVTLALPLAAAAQSRLERIETLSEQATELAYEGMIAQMPDLEGALPDAAWDDEMRTSGQCILDAYLAETSPAAVDAMLDRMETELASATPDDLMNGALEGGTPEGLSEARAQAITSECRMTEILMQRMMASEAMTIMMQANQ